MRSFLRLGSLDAPGARLWAAAFVAGATLLAYSNTLRNGFVWDDHSYVESNAFVRDPANLRVLLDPRFYLGTHEVLVGNRPVFLASLLVDRALWGGRPAGYHATSALIHAANSLWVFGLALALGLAAPAAFWAALLFGLHPIQSEAVDLVSFRSEPLAAFFLFCALGAYLRARGRRGGAALAWTFASAGSFGLALLSKESALALPALVVLVELYFPCAEGRRARLGAAMAAYFLVACAYAGFWAPRFHYHGMEASSSVRWALDRLASMMPTSPGPGRLELGIGKGVLYHSSSWEWNALYADRKAWWLTMIKSAGGTIRLLVFPEPLVADRAPLIARSVWDAGFLLSLGALSAMAFYAVWARRRRPVPAFGAAWALATLAPAMNLVPLYSPMAERYAYLATAGAAFAGAAVLSSLTQRRGRAALLMGGFLAGAFGMRTFERNFDWRSDETLFLSGPPGVPRSSMARFNRGEVLRRGGRLREALEEYRLAVEARPAFAEAWLGLGSTLASMGDPARAKGCFDKALSLAPGSPLVHFAYGLFLESYGQNAPARERFARALELEPGLAEARAALERLKRPKAPGKRR